MKKMEVRVVPKHGALGLQVRQAADIVGFKEPWEEMMVSISFSHKV